MVTCKLIPAVKRLNEAGIPATCNKVIAEVFPGLGGQSLKNRAEREFDVANKLVQLVRDGQLQAGEEDVAGTTRTVFRHPLARPVGAPASPAAAKPDEPTSSELLNRLASLERKVDLMSRRLDAILHGQDSLDRLLSQLKETLSSTLA